MMKFKIIKLKNPAFKCISLILTVLGVVFLVSSCNTGSTTPTSTSVQYSTFNYSGAYGSSTILTGVRAVTNTDNVYISGIYQESYNAPNQGLLYTGPINSLCSTCFQILNMPNAPGRTVTGTSFYGPDYNGYNNVTIVGSYTSVETESRNFGLLYQGPTDGTGVWTVLDPSVLATNPGESVTAVYARSTMGGLVVGNFDTNITDGRAFIYNIANGSYVEIKKPGALSITAYGIWQNGSTSFTITGGYSDTNYNGLDIGYVVDYTNSPSASESFTNWESYSYGNQTGNLISHFEGITTDGQNGYNLASDFTLNNESGAAFANISRNSDGTFESDATWTYIGMPNSLITSANTVYQNYIIGVYVLNGNPFVVNGFTALVPIY